jgi:NAD(P)-dependent dehydrogenase (short-subunit alcohol dehydrogenase family)
MAETKVALVVGAGEATGGAIARRFAREGYVACVTRRSADKLAPLVAQIESEGGRARAFGSDARSEEQVAGLVQTIERELGPIEVCVFNVGGNVRFPIRETTERVYRKVWEMAALAGFLVGKGFAAFAGAKHALRALAQSMARELGPEGIHVAHVVIDGAIDTPFIRENFPERYKLKEQGGILDPEAIAENYWRLHCQARSAWTHELDLRPWMEPW